MSDRHESRVGIQLLTSFDVAKRAGVSQSTVSLVLNGKAAERVSPRTQEAVRRVAQELGYQPSMAARSLRLGRTHVAALIIPDVRNPVFAAVLQGAEQAARLRDYTVVQVSTGNNGLCMPWLPTLAVAFFFGRWIFLKALSSNCCAATL